jgi:hypothetical protein
MLYLYLDIQEEDTLLPPAGILTWIRPGQFVPLSDSGEQLCWSVAPNPMKVVIFAKERQPFSPCRITPDYILIPSESGWPPKMARVLLRRRVYSGMLPLSAQTPTRAGSRLGLTQIQWTIRAR